MFLLLILKAIEEKRRIQITYSDPGGPKRDRSRSRSGTVDKLYEVLKRNKKKGINQTEIREISMHIRFLVNTSTTLAPIL
jgi:hypothetical protein